MSIPALSPNHSQIQGTLMLFAGANRPERGPDHLSPSNVELKNLWSYTSDLPNDVMLRTEKNYLFYCIYTRKRKFIYWVCVPLQEGMPSERCESALMSFLLRSVAEILTKEFHPACCSFGCQRLIYSNHN